MNKVSTALFWSAESVGICLSKDEYPESGQVYLEKAIAALRFQPAREVSQGQHISAAAVPMQVGDKFSVVDNGKQFLAQVIADESPENAAAAIRAMEAQEAIEPIAKGFTGVHVPKCSIGKDSSTHFHRKIEFSRGAPVQDPRLHITANKELLLLARSFQQNPQAQQSSSSIHSNRKTLNDWPCGNSGKVEKIYGCRRQVFVTVEFAFSTARSLLAVGIIANVVRCGRCKKIHLNEKRCAQRGELLALPARFS